MTEEIRPIAEEFLKIEYRQAYRLLTEVYYDENVQYIYNPLDYARETHGYFVRKYLKNSPKVLFLGINPGPWGMAQHGVPFGDIAVVTEWLKIKGNVYKPHREHPARPILGLQSRRSEVSGKRFWNLMQDLCIDPQVFFDQCFVHNYCPLSYLASNAKNITPLHLKGGAAKRALHEICDQAFRETVALLKPSLIVGIGNYSRDRALAALRVDPRFSEVKVVVITHPSPANPVANKGWMSLALKELEEAGVLQFLKWTVSDNLRHSVQEEAQRLQQEAAKAKLDKQNKASVKSSAATPTPASNDNTTSNNNNNNNNNTIISNNNTNSNVSSIGSANNESNLGHATPGLGCVNQMGIPNASLCSPHPMAPMQPNTFSHLPTPPTSVDMGYFMTMLRNQEFNAAMANGSDFNYGNTGLPLRPFVNPDPLMHSALDFSGGANGAQTEAGSNAEPQPTNLCKRSAEDMSLGGHHNASHFKSPLHDPKVSMHSPAGIPQGQDDNLKF